MRILDLFKNKMKLIKAQQLCLNLYQKGDLTGLDGATRMLYNQNPNNAIAVLRYVAENSACDGDTQTTNATTLAKFWQKLDEPSFGKYKKELEKDHSSEIKKFKWNDMQKYMNMCQAIANKPECKANKSKIEESIKDIKVYRDDFLKKCYGYFVTLNKNDNLVLFVAYFIQTIILPACKILEILCKNNVDIKKQFEVLIKFLEKTFNVKLGRETGMDDIVGALMPIYSKSTLRQVVTTLNTVLASFSKLKI
ncbi:MAG: hypothetical protein LBR79_06375 [Oscillospiraceae bacterium]|jgi:hypothetical protein|nr:hypothetical protein [Oscillospiraceae bacterium]